MTTDERRSELIRLVESEIEGLRSLMAGVLTAGNTVRVAGIAVWSAAIAAAIVNDEPLLAALAVVALLAAGLVDAYHGHLYAAVLGELSEDERIINRYYELLGRYPTDQRRSDKLDEILAGHRFGIHSKLRRPTLHPGLSAVPFLLSSRPRIVFVVLYPALATLGAASAILLALR
jgi:hypothetical protein